MVSKRYKPTPLPAYSSQQEFLRIFENARIGIYRSSPDGTEVLTNPHLLALSGYASEKDLQAAVKDIATQWYVDPNRRQTFISLLQKDGKIDNFESEVYQHNTKKRLWVSENAWVVRDNEGNILYYEGTVEDITIRKHYQIFQENLIQCIKDTLNYGLDDQMYQRLLERAVAAVPEAQAGSIMVETDGYYYFVAAVGFDLHALQKIALTPQEVFKFNLHSDHPQILKHSQNYTSSNALNKHTLETAGRCNDIKTTLCIPVLHNQQKALLFLDNFDDPDAFNDAAQNMANAFAQKIGSGFQVHDEGHSRL